MRRTHALIAGALVLLGCHRGKGTADGGPAEGPSAPPGFSVPALLKDDTQITLTSLADVEARRDVLVKFIWGPAGMPKDKLPKSVTAGVPNPFTDVEMKNLRRVDRLDIAMDKRITNEAFHYVPETSNGRLVIVHGGHDPLGKSGLGPVVAALVAEGYGVLATQMVCYTSSRCLGFPKVSPHNRMVPELKPGEGDVLQYFFEHLVVSLNYLRTRSAEGGFAPYHDFAIAGLSGGGWASVLYAAIDPTITTSFSCSGSEPMYQRHCHRKDDPVCIDGYVGDAEAMYFPLYKHIAGYLDLYAMSAAGTGRRHVMVQIRHDACCYGEDHYNKVTHHTWLQVVRGDEQKVQHFLGVDGQDHGSFRYEIDETSAHLHVISPTTLAQVILGELDGDRRPFAAASASAIYAADAHHDVLSYGLLEPRPGETTALTAAPAPPAAAPRPASPPATWTSTDFALVGTPSVVASSGGTDIFLRDTASALVHLHRSPQPSTEAAPDGGAGGGFTTEPLGGALAGDPAGVVTGDTLHVVGVGPTSTLTHWSKRGGEPAVMEVADPDTLVVGPPVLLASPDGSLDVLVKRLDGGLQHIHAHHGAWSSEEVAGAGRLRGFPAGALTPDGNLHAFARGLDDTLMEVTIPVAGGVSAGVAPEPVGASPVKMAGSPSAIVDPATDEVRVVTRSPSGDLDLYTLTAKSGWKQQHVKRPAGRPPSEGTASFTLSPVAAAGGVFARAEEGGIWFYAFKTGGWTWASGLVR